MVARLCIKHGRIGCECGKRQPWDASKRREKALRSGSKQQKRAKQVLLEHETMCHVCGAFGADEVDHVVPLAEGGADDRSNLRPIHRVPCHREKTAQEAQRGCQRAQRGAG